MLEYNLVGTSTEFIILKYFRKDLKPFVLAKPEHQDLELESFDQMVKKAINAKAKAVLQPRSNTKKIDHTYPHGNRPANFTVAKSQDSTMKDPWIKKPKVQSLGSLSGSQYSNESFKKARKKKKKKWY